MTRDRPVWRAGLLATVMLLVVGVTPAAAAPSGQWHRDNYGTEHERLTCRESAEVWTCNYDKVPEPGLAWDANTGLFTGREVTASWSCPEWFGATICDNVVAVYHGTAVYHTVGARSFVVAQEKVKANVDGQDLLFL
jgi:hypothetical protein